MLDGNEIVLVDFLLSHLSSIGGCTSEKLLCDVYMVEDKDQYCQYVVDAIIVHDIAYYYRGMDLYND